MAYLGHFTRGDQWLLALWSNQSSSLPVWKFSSCGHSLALDSWIRTGPERHNVICDEKISTFPNLGLSCAWLVSVLNVNGKKEAYKKEFWLFFSPPCSQFDMESNVVLVVLSFTDTTKSWKKPSGPYDYRRRTFFCQSRRFWNTIWSKLITNP
jgi:hypothetical protein